MKTLLINAHPDCRGEKRYSNRMARRFAERFAEKRPQDTLEILRLAETPAPRLTEDGLFGLWGAQAAGAPLSEEQQATLRRHDALLEQFLGAHRIVISMPVHNFNVPSLLKDYMDNILIARKTFRYVSGGSVGLMTDDRRALLLQASGSVYTGGSAAAPLEFSRMYLEAMFRGIMGFSSFETVRAQGTATRAWSEERDMPGVLAEVDAALDRLCAA
jgi:FMN-dependent NADH-azoreductase